MKDIESPLGHENALFVVTFFLSFTKVLLALFDTSSPVEPPPCSATKKYMDFVACVHINPYRLYSLNASFQLRSLRILSCVVRTIYLCTPPLIFFCSVDTQKNHPLTRRRWNVSMRKPSERFFFNLICNSSFRIKNYF